MLIYETNLTNRSCKCDIGNSLEFISLSLVLKILRDFDAFISARIRSHIFGHTLPRSTVSIFFSLKIITTSKYENLFRPIFETQIHFQLHVRYFKPLPIATCYLITIYVKSLYLHSKTYDMDLKWNLYVTSLSRRGTVNPSTQTFGNINLTETMTNLIVAGKFNQKRLEEFLFTH